MFCSEGYKVLIFFFFVKYLELVVGEFCKCKWDYVFLIGFLINCLEEIVCFNCDFKI